MKHSLNHQELRFNMRKWLLLRQNLPNEYSVGVDVACFGDWVPSDHLWSTMGRQHIA